MMCEEASAAKAELSRKRNQRSHGKAVVSCEPLKLLTSTLGCDAAGEFEQSANVSHEKDHFGYSDVLGLGRGALSLFAGG